MSSCKHMIAAAARRCKSLAADTRFMYERLSFANKSVHRDHRAWMHADPFARLNLGNLRFPAQSRRFNYFARQYSRVPSAECFKNLAFAALAQFLAERIDN